MMQLAFRFFQVEMRKRAERQSPITQKQLRQVERMLKRGRTLRAVAERLGMDHNQLWRRVQQSGIKRRCKLTSSEKQKAIELLNQDVPQSQIARDFGRHKSTINRLAMSQRKLSTGVQFAGTRTRVCPVHGAVNVWPCVACAAAQYREQRNRRG